MGVHLAADTQGEYPGSILVGFPDVFQDVVLVGDTDSGFAIGNKDYGKRPVRIPSLAQGRLERFVDGGTANGFQFVDKFHGLLHSLFVGFYQAFRKRIGLGGESDNVEPVVFLELAQAELEGFFGLIHLVGGVHRSRGIEDKDHVFLDDLFVLELLSRGNQYHEITVFVFFFLREQCEAEIFLGDGVVEYEVLVRKDVFLLESDDYFSFIFPVNIDSVGR